MGNRTHLPAGPVLLTGLAVMVGWCGVFFYFPKIVLTWFAGAILVFVSYGTLCSARRWIVAKRKQMVVRRASIEGQTSDGCQTTVAGQSSIDDQSSDETLRAADETIRVDRPAKKPGQTDTASDPIVKPSESRPV